MAFIFILFLALGIYALLITIAGYVENWTILKWYDKYYIKNNWLGFSWFEETYHGVRIRFNTRKEAIEWINRNKDKGQVIK